MYSFFAFLIFNQNTCAQLHMHVKNHHHYENDHNLNYSIPLT